MKLLDSYLNIQNELFEYFGYKEDCVVISFNDARKYFWSIIIHEIDKNIINIRFSESKENINLIYYEYRICN